MCLLMTEEIKTSPASEQGIPQNSTVQKTDASMASTQQLSGDLEVTPTASSRKSKLERAKTFDLFAATQEDGGGSDLEMIPPCQPPGAVRKRITPTEDRKRHILDFISPISNLTSLRDSPSTQSQLSSPLTSLMCSGTPAGVPKKLFTEPEPSNPQDNMDELLGLCSGRFTGNIGRLVDPVMETSRTGLEAELLGLCSGKFISQPVNMHSLKQDERQSVPTEDPAEVVLFSTDDEEDEVVQTRTHKKHKKLDFSDEELDLENDESFELPNVSKTKFVDYDSEENELVDPSEPQKLALSEFFEDEAELSESDWDSADEDEQGLDTLEFEEGDGDKLDQHKVKEQLDRIYMHHLLDNDRREVCMLQEILLEDGEPHSEGGGRERQFHWKNINNVDDSELPHHNSDSEVLDEAENEDEELWCRIRHERETFVQQHKVDDTLGDKSDSQLLKLGWAALKKTNSEDATKQIPSIKQTVSDPLASPDPKCPFNLVAQRGSFLARGQNALSRIAELTRDSTGGPVVGPKNSRNFVFATLSPEKDEDCSIETTSVQMKKRKQDPGVTPPIIKRLRVSDQHSRGRRLLDLLS